MRNDRGNRGGPGRSTWRCWCLIGLLASFAWTSPGRAEGPELISVAKIWDQAPHGAFTDLIRWRDRWYCTFRESEAHVGGNGKLRLLASDDGAKWESAALIAEEGIDLRDPKLSIAPDGRLMIVAGGSTYRGKELIGRRPRVMFSGDGREWTPPQKVLSEGEWLWRVTWHGGKAYGASYGSTPEGKQALRLYASANGVDYDLVCPLEVPDFPNETTLQFLPDGTMVALVRRERGNKHAWIGTSPAPYTEWSWKEADRHVGGPNFLQLPDGSLWASGRDHTPKGPRTALGPMTLEGYEPALTLPSGGDTSYPGLVWHDDRLWVSYYSSHEGKSAIYLAQVRIPARAKGEGAGQGADAGLPPALAPAFAPPAEFAGKLGDYRSPLLFDDGTPVRTAEDWKRRRDEILKAWHGLMGPWPEEIARPKVEVLDSTHRENFTQKAIRLEVAPGRTTDDAYLLIPDGEGPFPAVVVVFYDAKTGIGAEGTKPLRDFAYRLARKGFIALSLGSEPRTYYPSKEAATIQPLSFHAYVAANARNALANMPEVDPERIGIVGHSYGGKWAMFAACLNEKFACAAWSDPGIAFDESRSNVNYWDPWYLGYEPGAGRKPGIPSESHPRTGPYRTLIEQKRDLHELHALMAPRPFLVSGGAEDPPARWVALNHAVAVNRLLGASGRVGMTNRPAHEPTEESNAQIDAFFEHFLKR